MMVPNDKLADDGGGRATLVARLCEELHPEFPSSFALVANMDVELRIAVAHCGAACDDALAAPAGITLEHARVFAVDGATAGLYCTVCDGLVCGGVEFSG
jgi:hypothetical protein